MEYMNSLADPTLSIRDGISLIRQCHGRIIEMSKKKKLREKKNHYHRQQQHWKKIWIFSYFNTRNEQTNENESNDNAYHTCQFKLIQSDPSEP